MHEVSVQCWRPTGNAGYPSVYAQLKRYFIGGDPELEDVMYTAIPSTFEVGQLVFVFFFFSLSFLCLYTVLYCLYLVHLVNPFKLLY